MQVLEGKPWRYSHSQLAMWKRCKRLYHDAYILGHKEPKTANMAAGTWLAQNPIEDYAGRLPGQNDLEWFQNKYIGGEGNYFETLWANFLAEFGGDDSYDDPIFTLNLAKQILKAYKANPVQGKVVEIERTYEKEFLGGYLYTSRPDLVTETERGYDTQYAPGLIQKAPDWTASHTTWDIKLKTFNQQKAGDTWFASAPLSAFDDQCLGQAVCAGADAFGQIQFFVGKKDGALLGPVYVEQPVNPVLAEEWEAETLCEIEEIATWCNDWVNEPFPKNPDSCHAFGKDCHRLANCNFGFEGGHHANSSAS